MDIAVFCLALMGTDYPSFLQEAARVLKPHGTIWIAEVRFDTELLACKGVALPSSVPSLLSGSSAHGQAE